MVRDNRFASLIREVDLRLQDLRNAEGALVDAEAEVVTCRERRDTARESLKAIRTELFTAFPELAPEPPAVPAWSPPTQPGLPEPIEIDDPDGPMEWRERG